MDTKRLLIVEDDLPTRNLLKHALSSAGYDVSAVPDGPTALHHLQRHGLPHLVMLDLGLPLMDGFELSERIKKMGDVPIVILTAEDDEDSIVRGISEYAEDYMIKPIKPRELTARIRRVLSRISDFSYTAEPSIQVDSSVAIDFSNSCLHIEGVSVSLTPIEIKLLSVLVQNAGRVVSAEQLCARVWPSEEVFEETLRVHMFRLRRKFTYNRPTAHYIQTERGLGYMFSFPDR